VFNYVPAPNMFGSTVVPGAGERIHMVTTDPIAATDAPTDRPRETIDVRELPPPEPLRRTLERLTELGDAVLVQRNDRAPQHLYPKLADRGYAYDTVETDGAVVTVIWRDSGAPHD
jgi:TusA-related sulfurtransferase